MKFLKIIAACLCLVLLLSSCSENDRYQSSNFFVMDTFAEIRVYGTNKNANDALMRAKTVAEELDAKISATKEGSDTYAFNHVQAEHFSLDFVELTTLSLALSKATDGCFDVTAGTLIDLWKKCEAEARLPTEKEKAEALNTLGYQKLNIDENAVTKATPLLMIDFGAIGKGYSADKMAESLKSNGVKTGMISFVSSVTVFGERDFKIGIRQPDTSGELCGYLTLRECSLSVSGDYERFYEIAGKRYPHILDTKTGAPVSSSLHSVVVIANSGAVADALSTALFVMGTENAIKLYQENTLDFEFLCIEDDKIILSDGLASDFEVKTNAYRLLSLSDYISEN